MIIGKVECGERVVGGLQRGPGGKTFQTQSVNGGREKVSQRHYGTQWSRLKNERSHIVSVSRLFRGIFFKGWKSERSREKDMRTGGKRRVLINTRGKIIRKYFERTKKNKVRLGLSRAGLGKVCLSLMEAEKPIRCVSILLFFSPNRKHSYILIDSYTYGVMWD